MLSNNKIKMHNSYNTASTHHPKKSVVFQNNLWSTPRSMAVDGLLSYGGGTAVGLNLARKSFGEYYERDHFFNDIHIDQTGRIEDVIEKNKSPDFIHYITQMSLPHEDWEKHAFAWTKVTDFKNNNDSYFFYNGISLNGLSKDSSYYPFNDSCSCATHYDKDLCLENSLSEFIERQAFLGSWLSKGAKESINTEVLFEFVPYQTLIRDLLDNGELYIFNNNIGLPGYSIVIFYFAKSPLDRVQYSIGAKAGLNLKSALISAIEELWQCYTFLYNGNNTKILEEKAGSNYHLKFKQYNHLSTKEIIPYFTLGKLKAIPVRTISYVNKQPTVSFNEAIDALIQKNYQLYYYHHYSESLKFHFTKIVSPHFFAHMALDEIINVENRYSLSLGVKKSTAYMTRLPFP